MKEIKLTIQVDEGDTNFNSRFNAFFDAFCEREGTPHTVDGLLYFMTFIQFKAKEWFRVEVVKNTKKANQLYFFSDAIGQMLSVFYNMRRVGGDEWKMDENDDAPLMFPNFVGVAPWINHPTDGVFVHRAVRMGWGWGLGRNYRIYCA
jgi:hypothetical protein